MSLSCIKKTPNTRGVNHCPTLNRCPNLSYPLQYPRYSLSKNKGLDVRLASFSSLTKNHYFKDNPAQPQNLDNHIGLWLLWGKKTIKKKEVAYTRNSNNENIIYGYIVLRRYITTLKNVWRPQSLNKDWGRRRDWLKKNKTPVIGNTKETCWNMKKYSAVIKDKIAWNMKNNGEEQFGFGYFFS